MNKGLCFGELLLRYSPKLNLGWIRQASMPVYVGGAEVNTAAALALWNIPTELVTVLPDNYLSREIQNYLNSRHIGTAGIRLSGSRIGSYYLPQGTDLKGAGVIYDREHSSFYNLQPGDIDWDEVLDGVSWLHLSAISPALNARTAAACLEAVRSAAAKNIVISIDLNYREKLWRWGKTPAEIMPGLVEHASLVMGNIWAAEKMLGIAVDPTLGSKKEHYLRQAEITSRELIDRFPSVQTVANTFRFDTAGTVQYYATLLEGGEFSVSREYSTDTVIDRVGSGDCFMAGLIYGTLNKLSYDEKINFAAAAAFSKLFIQGDTTTSSVADVYRRLNG